jgi:hypothetical protein
MFEVLNPTIQTCAVIVVGFVVGFGDSIEENNNIFGVDASMEKSSCALVIGELSLFRSLYVFLATCVDFLACGAFMKPNSQMLVSLLNKY